MLALLALAACRPNDQLRFCGHELRTIADTIDYSVLENPEWRPLFVVDGAYVADVLTTLADTMDRRLADCPCIGTCSRLDECAR